MHNGPHKDWDCGIGTQPFGSDKYPTTTCIRKKWKHKTGKEKLVVFLYLFYFRDLLDSPLYFSIGNSIPSMFLVKPTLSNLIDNNQLSPSNNSQGYFRFLKDKCYHSTIALIYHAFNRFTHTFLRMCWNSI